MAEKLVTTVHLTREETDTLRELAARLGLFYKTGPTAGQQGNPKALCKLLVEAYKSNPDNVFALLESFRENL
jgi:hypothetical protein